MLKYKINILDALREKGYTPIIVRRNRLISEAAMTDFRRGVVKFNTGTIDTLCRLLEIQPGDLLEYVPDEPETKPESADSIPAGAEDIF